MPEMQHLFEMYLHKLPLYKIVGIEVRTPKTFGCDESVVDTDNEWHIVSYMLQLAYSSRHMSSVFLDTQACEAV